MLNENEDIIDFEGFSYNNRILKEPTVYGKKSKIHCFSNHRKNCLTVQIHNDAQYFCLQNDVMVLTGIKVFTDYSFINDYFVELRIRFPKLTVFVTGKNKVDFNSKDLENVRDLNEFGCRPITELHKDFVLQSQHN